MLGQGVTSEVALNMHEVRVLNMHEVETRWTRFATRLTQFVTQLRPFDPVRDAIDAISDAINVIRDAIDAICDAIDAIFLTCFLTIFIIWTRTSKETTSILPIWLTSILALHAVKHLVANTT